tara:strand:+ start:601 stop:882 length:282 start_codon:yes stop_codon:yes gene_type:complete
MKLSKRKLRSLIIEEISSTGPAPPCYLVVVDYEDYDESPWYASSSLSHIVSYLRTPAASLLHDGHTDWSVVKTSGAWEDSVDITNEVKQMLDS